jgi:hypothetical protein
MGFEAAYGLATGVLRRYQGNKVSWLPGNARIQRSIVFYTLWDNIKVTKLIACECPHSTLLWRFTRFEAISRQQRWLLVNVRIQHFYCILQALRRCQGNKADSLGVPSFRVCIVLYTLWDDARVTKLFPWGCPHSTLVLCSTSFERMPG